MAKTHLKNNSLTWLVLIMTLTISSFLDLATATATATADTDDTVHTFSRNLSPKKKYRREKLSQLHFYFQDKVSGRNPTAVHVAGPMLVPTAPKFGMVVMIDDPLTVGQKPTSKEVGRAKGLYATASHSDLGLLMVLNYCFTEGKYNGSTLSILGHNPITEEVREMPIVGGSGLFRYARGHAKARTHWFNATTFDAIVEYDVYVFHY